MLNLSQNQLSRSIPQEKQFGTFENNSYDGKLELCGFPLSIKCSTDELMLPPPLPSVFQEDHDSSIASGFGWKVVLIGYGCWLLLGITMGYAVFKIGKPKWLVWFIEWEKKNDKKESQDKEGSNASELPSGEFDKLLFRLICAMILYEVV